MDASPACGVKDSSEVVFHPVDLDEICYAFSAEGTRMVLIGGVWSEATQKVMAPINALARRHGVDIIHLYDFSTDGKEETSIKRDLTEQETYDGPDKKESNPFAIYNYLYGEIVTNHLTNLGDWVPEDRKAGCRNDITSLKRCEDAGSVARLEEPFLCLYNKDNTTDNSGNGGSEGTYPIVWAVELGSYVADGATEEEIVNVLEEKIFCHVDEGCKVQTYDFADYMLDAFSLNKRGHAYKTEPSFVPGEKIQVQKVSFQTFYWMLQQKGAFIFMIAGPWCAFSQGGVATVNDYAVANGLRAYMTDIRMDSKHAIDFWYYARRNELTMSCPPMRKYYIDVWGTYFPGAEIMCSLNPNQPGHRSLTVDYTDENGVVHSALGVGVPYILSYDKDHLSTRGHKMPVLASKHDAGELINCTDSYVYHKPNYLFYKAGIYRVYYAYFEDLGREDEMKDITVDRTKKKVKGEPEKHPETEFYHKDHDWYKERADRV